MKKKNIILYFLFVAIFGCLGIYLTFFAGNTNNYDSKTKAYKIDPNESRDSDGTTYYPIYYFKVGEEEYVCKAGNGSSAYPSEYKNTVYYDSNDPTKCKTEYEKSTSWLGGILCLIVTVGLSVFFFIRKPHENTVEPNQMNEVDREINLQLEQENAEAVAQIASKVTLIYKRIILGIIIAILLIFILIDTVIIKQTIVSKDYPETVATFVERKTDGDSTVSDDCVYTFTDKNGKEQKITYSISKEDEPKGELKIKYNEKNPQDYYTEGNTMDTTGIIWYIVKLVALILLVFMFWNKKLLFKINISAGR